MNDQVAPPMVLASAARWIPFRFTVSQHALNRCWERGIPVKIVGLILSSNHWVRNKSGQRLYTLPSHAKAERHLAEFMPVVIVVEPGEDKVITAYWHDERRDVGSGSTSTRYA